MATVQTILDRARIPLNDDAKVRWPDTDLLAHDAPEGVWAGYYQLRNGRTHAGPGGTPIGAYRAGRVV